MTTKKKTFNAGSALVALIRATPYIVSYCTAFHLMRGARFVEWSDVITKPSVALGALILLLVSPVALSIKDDFERPE